MEQISIGGYFGLETNFGKEFHSNLVSLNTGRNAFEYILKGRNYKHIYIPYYTCDVLLEPLEKLDVSYDFYSINDRMEPVIPRSIRDRSAFLYTNYFGLKTGYINRISKEIKNLIIDASQAFFFKPLKHIDTFYSSRKFFGVPDGSYVSSDANTEEQYDHDTSLNRSKHLIIRIDKSAEEGYDYFKRAEELLANQPIKKMSKLTKAILSGIDYKYVFAKRNQNFLHLHKFLHKENKMKWISVKKLEGPMVYPFYSESISLREKLIREKIYLPIFWSNKKIRFPKGSLEQDLVHNLFPLPVDQRYGLKEMDKIIRLINA